MDKQRSNYTQEELQTFEQRAVEFIKKNPNANRTRIANYAGVGITVKQVRKTHDWGNMLGSLK